MRIHQVATVFHVTDIESSLRFYKDVLGFTDDFRVGNYVGLKLDGFNLHLSQAGDHGRRVGAGLVYVFCDGVDDYYARRIVGKEVRILQPPADQEYGMRDFVLHDPDGNRICLGQATGTSSNSA